MRERGNSLLYRVPKDLLILLTVLLFSTASFGLGMVSERERASKGSQESNFWIEEMSTSTRTSLPAGALQARGTAGEKVPVVPMAQALGTVVPEEGKYVASKSGTKYYLPTCSGVRRIKEENKIWFATVDDAQASGRTPATNCPGL